MSDHDWENTPFPVPPYPEPEAPESETLGAGISEKPFLYVNEEDTELIGVKDAILKWASESGGDNSVADAGNSGLHLTIFDITSRADGARIKLLNDSGATQYVTNASVFAKPIIRMSGKLGFVHDEFVDFQDIALNGENTAEFGNNYVVTKAQLESLADYFWKALGKAKHVYGVTIAGRCWWFEPGEWYTLQVGGAGQREYIDSVCECYSVQIEATADGLGATRILFREVEQNWVKDSNATARYLATGDPRWKPNNFGKIVVASSTYMGVADYYCDGTADQTEIQAAIDYVAKSFGGGLVELTEGQFNITAAIDISYDNIMLRGAGAKTIIEKNCNDYGIKVIGISGSEIRNVELSNFKLQQSTADTNANDLIHFEYVIDCIIQNIDVQGIYDADKWIPLTAASNNIELNHSQGCVITSCRLSQAQYRGLVLDTTNHDLIIGNIVKDSRVGIYFIGDNDIANANIVTGCNSFGLGMAGNGNQLTNNIITNNCLNSPSAGAIHLVTGSKNSILNNQCIDNGNLLYYADCEDPNSPPYIENDTYSLSGCTIARSTVQYYGGSYSRKITQTAASTGEFRFCDNITKTDLHEIYPGYSYALSAYTYLLSTGSPTTAEVKLILGYTTSGAGAWHETTGYVSTGKDAWGLAETSAFAVPSGAVGFKALVRVNAAASTDEYFYIDNVRLQPLGTHNLYGQSFYDNGTNTYFGL